VIRTIAKKEFLENVLSRKFLLAFILAVIILGTGVVAMCSSYEEKKDWYDTQLNSLEQQLENGTSGYTAIAETELFKVLEEPGALSTLISGQQTTVQLGLGTVGTMLTAASSSEETSSSYTSPLWERFGMLDLTFIIGFLMSLMAIIFSYNSISGEKENGTLKLTLTNSVPKDHVLLGKYIGGTASVLLPFVLSMIIALSIVAVVVGIPFSSADYLAIGVLVLVGCATISAFYLLGVLVSSLTKRSAVSLLVCLFIWIFLAQGIGNVASLTATATTSGMSYDEYRQEYLSISQEVMREYGRENMRQALEIIQERQTALATEFRAQQEAQLNVALSVSMISPAESYTNVGQALAGLSSAEGEQIQEQVSDYIAALSKEYTEWAAAQRENQGGFPGQGGENQGGFPGQDGENFFRPGGVTNGGTSETFTPTVHLEDYYQPWGISERVGSVTNDLVAIVMFNILLFVGAYVAFLRYDVR
jgi:ABC-type transport system involved in multi-copper enzyme maturation permease subunit